MYKTITLEEYKYLKRRDKKLKLIENDSKSMKELYNDWNDFNNSKKPKNYF